MKKRFVCLFLIIIILAFSTIQVFAHPQMLDVVYDNCTGVDNADGIDEMWYLSVWGGYNYHISHDIATIKYYFESASQDNVYTWTDGISEETANEIKEAFVNSMKKWDNVYFYSQDEFGNIIKNKIINIVEGTEEDHNLSIFPTRGTDYVANCGATWEGGAFSYIEISSVVHAHCTDWEINVNLDYFVYNESNVVSVDLYRARTGAHELGHIIGLFDLDNGDLCQSTIQADWHHEEVLMGYGDTPGRAFEISYKDIAGAAIARGFHTDNDHMWLNMGCQLDGTYKLVCSICNGVKYVDSLNEYYIYTYGLCDGQHDIQSGNMMAVASYGTKDYYKCKYCRYVAPYGNIVEQNYRKTNYSSYYHLCENTVPGLEYKFYEVHNLVDHECTECDYSIHSYTHHYKRKSDMTHWSYCSCGKAISQAHVVSSSHSTICMLCNGIVGGGLLNSIPGNLPHTENGSYILPNGIIVLVPEDEEAYLNGTLEFRTGEVM